MSDEKQKPTIEQVAWVLQNLAAAQRDGTVSLRSLICDTMGFDPDVYASLLQNGGLDADSCLIPSSETESLTRQLTALREAGQDALTEVRHELYSEKYYGGSPERIEQVLSDALGKETPDELKAEAVLKQLRAAHRVLGYAGHTPQCAGCTSDDACNCGYMDALQAYRQAQRSFPI